MTAAFILVQTASGVVPQKWELRSKDDFLEGKFRGISVSDEGFLSLSPREEAVEGPAEEFYLSYLQTSQGTAYLGTGHGGKIYKISGSGKAELYFQVSEMDVYCLAVDRKGNLYAGTSPNGKIYKITASGEGEEFFNPREKYIWDLLFTEEGDLLAAVGETGGVYRISQEGEGLSILKAEQNHILCLKMMRDGSVLAGSGGKGLLYRFSLEGRASVLFESPFEEIKSIALDDRGYIYAAAGGKTARPEEDKIKPEEAESGTEITLTVTPESGKTKIAYPSREKQPSALYKVSSQGLARKVWESGEELIYSLSWDQRDQKLVFGTGNKGRVYVLNRQEEISLLLQKDSEQIYSLVPFDSKIFILANNPSQLTVLYPEQREKGEYLSQVFDSRTVSSWGRILWRADVPQGSTLQLQTRSGNSQEPSQTWSDWSPPYQKGEGEQILSPKARYIQYKIIFQTPSAKTSPVVQKVVLFYLQANVEPEITSLKLLPPNQVYLKPPPQEEIIWGEDVNIRPESEARDKAKTVVMAKEVERKGFQTVLWKASDENGDNLLFSLYIRREEESQWRVLRDKWKEKIYVFDTLTFPDGVYFIKVEASDVLSNPQGTELKSEKVSSPLVIDNSLPVVKNFQAAREKNQLRVTFSAEDSMTPIEEVHYLLRPDAWKIVFPEDGICDSKQESFRLNINLPSQSDNLITLKVKDSHGNMGVYRHTF